MEAIQNLVEDLTQRLEKVGVYLQTYELGTNDLEVVNNDGNEQPSEEGLLEKIINGESIWIIQSACTLGSVAFSDRVQKPDDYRNNDEFLSVMPTEVEMMRAKFLEKGLAVFEDDDEDSAG